MTRLNVLLVLALLGSALFLVRTQYESRRLFMALEKASADARRLHNEQERLEIEKRAQATTLRVDRLARERLQMRPANAALTHYVAAPKPLAAASAPALGGAP